MKNIKLNTINLEGNKVLIKASYRSYEVKVVLDRDGYENKLSQCHNIKDIAVLV